MDKNTPQATPSQKKEIDFLMNELGISNLQMMELAARDIARVIMKHTKGPVLFFCGKGHNGGDGLCAARHLINCNIPVAIILVEDEKHYVKEEKKHLSALKKLNASIFRFELPDIDLLIKKSDMLVDAVLGTGARIELNNKIKRTIQLINSSKKKVLSVDVPTGIDSLTGKVHDKAIIADYTVALGIPVRGIINNKNAGKIYVSDIGIPDRVYSAVGLSTKPRFHKKSIIRL